MRVMLAALLGTTILLGACGGGGGGKSPSGGGGTHTVPFDPDDAPLTPLPIDPPGSGNEPFSWRPLFAWDGVSQTPQTRVIRDEAEYEAITPPIPTPPVDFDREIVVAIFLGTNLNSDRLRFEEIVQVGDGADVRWVRLVPGPDWPPSTIPTQAYAVAALTRVEGPITFTGRTEIVPLNQE